MLSTRDAAFTIVELLMVIIIIIILAGLILALSSYVQDKASRSRAETEIAAMSAALESYKADNGIYPRGNADLSTTTPYDTDSLDAKLQFDPTQSVYQKSSLYLFTQLSGLNTDQTPITGAKSYFTFKSQMLGGIRDTTGNITVVTCLRDPFGSSYGYSTAQAANPGGPAGYNPTFDLWSTSGGKTSSDTSKWLKNW